MPDTNNTNMNKSDFNEKENGSKGLKIALIISLSLLLILAGFIALYFTGVISFENKAKDSEEVEIEESNDKKERKKDIKKSKNEESTDKADKNLLAKNR